MNKMMHLMIPISPGEVVDKVTILDIKSEKIVDEQKLINIKNEQRVLTAVLNSFIKDHQDINMLREKLRQINEQLWDYEDIVRNCERNKDFGEPFIEAARQIYQTNDLRSEIKKQINILLDSDIIEEKSYTDYQ
jgi:predicted metal-dependent hydrolase